MWFHLTEERHVGAPPPEPNNSIAILNTCCKEEEEEEQVCTLAKDFMCLFCKALCDFLQCQTEWVWFYNGKRPT